MSSTFSVEYWSKFHIEDLYHHKYQECLGWFMEATFVVSCVFYGFTAYIILTKSPKQMGAFKYTVFTQLTFNMAYKALMFIYNPIFHFPLIAVSFDRSFLPISSTVATTFFGFEFFVIAAAAFALFFSSVTRLFAVFSINTRISFKVGVIGGCGIILFAWGTINTPMFLMCLKFDDSWTSMEKTVPALLEIRKELPNTYATNPNLVSHLLTPFAAIAGIWIVAYGVIFITLNVMCVIQLRKIKKIVSSTTYALQKMLHTSLIIQTLNMFIFCLIPAFNIFFALISQISYGSWITNFQIPFSSLHLIVDAPLLIYFVKPYRNCVLKLITKRKLTRTFVTEPPSFTQIK